MARYKEIAKKMKEEKENIKKQLLSANKKLKIIEEERNKRLSVIVYCSNCQMVGSVKVPHGISIKNSGCAWCGVTGCGYLVTKVR